ncbi:MAG: GspMb/PilO family protein [Planctomycetota bacterium]|jgi:Tfp pilus assembly protein PilO
MKVNYGKYFKTTALVWVCSAALFFLVYSFAFVPQKKLRGHIEKRLLETKQDYEFALKAAEEKTRIQLEEHIDHLRHSLNDFVIDSRDSASLTLDISRIASEKELASFTIGRRGERRDSEIPGCEQIYENRINVSFTAGFNQFACFLNALERNQPVVFIDEFSITRSRKGGSSHKVDMGLAFLVRKTRDS